MTHDELTRQVVVSRCPIVSSAPTAIARVVSLDGLTNVPAVLRFERVVHRLRESESLMRLCLGGDVLETSYIHNDHYGFLTSAEGIVKDSAKGRAAKLKKGSGVSVVVETTVTDRFVTDIPPEFLDALRFYAETQRRYLAIPGDWLRDGEALETWLATPFERRWDEGIRRPGFEPEEVARAIVWSSEWSAVECAKAMAELRQRVLPEVMAA